MPELVSASAADAARIATVLNEIATAHYGENDLTEAEIATWFEHEQLEVLLAEDGGLSRRVRRPLARGRPRPVVARRAGALPGEGAAAAALIAELERRSLPYVDPGALAMTYVSAVDETMREVVEAAGYRSIRSSFRMTIGLDEPEDPEWPDGIDVATFAAEDEQTVFTAHQEAFRDHWEFREEPIDKWRKWLVGSPQFPPPLPLAPGPGRPRVSGFFRSAPSALPGPASCACSGLAARGGGGGAALRLALLRHSFAEMKARGMTRASLGVDGENLTGAVALYERAGMRVERRSECWRRRLHEHPAREVPQLPDAHGGRDRPGVRVPLLRQNVCGRARSRAARVGNRRARPS